MPGVVTADAVPAAGQHRHGRREGRRTGSVGVPGCRAPVRRKLQLPRLRIHVGDHAGRPAADGYRHSGGGHRAVHPETQWSLGGQYDRDTTKGTFSVRLDGSYQGKLFTNAENTSWSTIDGRFLANARLSWSDPQAKWRASVEVQNLFDKYYYLSVSDVTTSLGVVTGVPGLPRTYTASIERRF